MLYFSIPLSTQRPRLKLMSQTSTKISWLRRQKFCYMARKVLMWKYSENNPNNRTEFTAQCLGIVTWRFIRFLPCFSSGVWCLTWNERQKPLLRERGQSSLCRSRWELLNFLKLNCTSFVPPSVMSQPWMRSELKDNLCFYHWPSLWLLSMPMSSNETTNTEIQPKWTGYDSNQSWVPQNIDMVPYKEWPSSWVAWVADVQ